MPRGVKSSKTVRSDVLSKPLDTYGFPVFTGYTQLHYDMMAFANRQPVERGGRRRIEHFKNITDVIFPGLLEWHSWTYDMMNALCEERWICFAGAAGAGKTFASCVFAVAWWLCQPDSSSVILTSTTGKALKKRAWAEIQMLYSLIPGPRFGNMVASQMAWQSSKGDDKHAILGVAVEEGNMQRAMDNIKGVHTARQLVIIDEFTSTPPAITAACVNLHGYPKEFILLGIGNPNSRFDEMGKFSEPEGGWSSVSIADQSWRTKPQLDGKSGLVVRFDAELSPNITEGRVVSRHLPTKEKVDAARKSGAGENSPHFWSNFKGFWPPDGLTKTVLTESVLAMMRVTEKHVFTGNNIFTLASLDPAFGGGDRPVLRFAKCGEVSGNVLGIELYETIILQLNAASSNPIHYQLAESVRRECEARNCPPENFSLDSSGEGGGLADILARTWSSRIHRVEFGGSPSTFQVSHEDARLCSDVYDRKVTELWFTIREFALSGQLKGLTTGDCWELTNRFFDDSKKKISIETKKDMKARIGRSPDLGDSLAVMCELAKRKGISIAATGETVVAHKEWDRKVDEINAVYEDVSYGVEELEEMEVE